LVAYVVLGKEELRRARSISEAWYGKDGSLPVLHSAKRLELVGV